MRLVNAILVFVFSLIFCAAFHFDRIAQADEKVEKGVSFRWAFGATIGPQNDRRLIAITRDTILETGDELKMLVEMKKRCFIYLIYHTTPDKLHVLFPYNLQQFSEDYDVAKKYYIPQGDKWIELDEEVGIETFYLLASLHRLTELETLLEQYSSAAAEEKKGLSKLVLAEIRKIRKKHLTLTTSPERPVSVGGNFRGLADNDGLTDLDLDQIADEISTSEYYSRTFTIEHE